MAMTNEFFIGQTPDGFVRIYGRRIGDPSGWVVRNPITGDRYTGRVNIFTETSPKTLWLSLEIKNGEVQEGS